MGNKNSKPAINSTQVETKTFIYLWKNDRCQIFSVERQERTYGVLRASIRQTTAPPADWMDLSRD